MFDKMHFIKKKSIELEKQLQLVCETHFHDISKKKERRRMIRNRKKRIQRIKKEIQRDIQYSYSKHQAPAYTVQLQ